MQHAPARELLHFIKNSPTCYHVTENIRQKLLANGYTELSERERWEVAPGGKYFVRRNGSSTIAFRVPEMIDGGFTMAAAHSDSPTFRLKEHPDRRSAHYVQLSTEKYGGMLMATWFDRPLSVAGRLFVRENGAIAEKLVNVDRDLLVIPSVAIHMNRNANDGMKFAAKAVCLREAMQPEFRTYAENIVKNASALADVLLRCGFRLVSGGTDNHLMLLDLRGEGLTGKELQDRLDSVHITLNKNAVPNDPQKPSLTSGVRIGTPAVTTRGLRPSDMEPLARCIWLAVHDFEASRETILETVRSITARYPIYPNA